MVNKVGATYADIQALPEHQVGEIIDGELFVSPRPRTRHGIVASALLSYVHPAFHRGAGGPGGWWIITEPELHLGRQVMVPDLAGWRRSTLPSMPDVVGVTVAPDWVCEVLSPSTALLDRRKKLPRYAEHGVGHVWLVDPVLETVEILRRHDQGWLLVATYAENERIRAEPFDALEIDLATVWLRTPAGERVSEPAGPSWDAGTRP